MSEVNPYESPRESDESNARPPGPLQLPAWGIIVLSSLVLVTVPISLIVEYEINRRYFDMPSPIEDVVYGIWMFLTAIVGLVGGLAMLRMKNRRLVVATAILACVPYIGIAGGCLTAAFGLIALMRLRRKEVWEAFQG